MYSFFSDIHCYGVITLTETDTDKMGKVPNGIRVGAGLCAV